MAKVTFDVERCKGCGLCETVCPKQIIALEKNEGMMVLLVPLFFGLFPCCLHRPVRLSMALEALSAQFCGEGVSGRVNEDDFSEHIFRVKYRFVEQYFRNPKESDARS